MLTIWKNNCLYFNFYEEALDNKSLFWSNKLNQTCTKFLLLCSSGYVYILWFACCSIIFLTCFCIDLSKSLCVEFFYFALFFYSYFIQIRVLLLSDNLLNIILPMFAFLANLNGLKTLNQNMILVLIIK